MTYYVTFGVNHPLSDNWIEIEAPDRHIARLRAFSTFGAKWAFIYDEEHFEPKYCPAGKVGKTIKE